MNRWKNLTILNASILTEYGEYEFRPVTLAEARQIIREADNLTSAIGHESTAMLLTELLGRPVAANRIEYRQQPGDAALVFKLKSRPPEGAVLDRDQLEKIGYEFGLIIRRS
jgi:hypothetical protein